jgi:hypothetical protein
LSLLPCDGNLEALGVVSGRFWNLEALAEHMSKCPRCDLVYRALASAVGGRGGRAGKGVAKRRGSTEHYRKLARASWAEPQS